MKNLFTLIVALFSTFGCSPEKYHIVKTSELQEYTMPDGKRQIEISLIRSFILDKECKDDSGIKFADAFLAKVGATNDTVLIMSVCRRTFDFLKPKYKGPLWLIVDSANVDRKYPTELATNIDDSFDLKRYRVLIAPINNLKD